MNRTIAVFLGTRPEAIKMAPVIRELELAEGLEPVVVSTGQHAEMLDQVVELFDFPVHERLDVMRSDQTLAGLSARLLEGVDAWLARARPDFALVQGDTTTVFMAALACFYRGVRVGRVEAGLRTGDLASPFPEEANRKLVTPLAALHFPPTEVARGHLLEEGVPEERILVTGNTVIDALELEVARQEEDGIAGELDVRFAELLGRDWSSRPFVLVTGHRRENFGAGFESVCRALRALAQRFPDHRFVYPVHLNPRVRGPVFERLAGLENVVLIDPLPYRPFVALLRRARLVLTDSGGVQEEAPGLGKPVLVMRDTTERPEGVAAGTVRLVGTDESSIVAGVTELLRDEAAYRRMAESHNPYGDGRAAPRIVQALQRELGVEVTDTGAALPQPATWLP